MPDLDEINPPIRLWRRLPVIVKAVLTGGLVALAGTTPWALLVSANTRHWSAVPWAVLPTLLYLGLYWRYVRGDGWPLSTRDSRRINCRMNRVSENVWGSAILAGILGLVSIVLLQRLMNRLVVLPHQQQPDISQFPLVTVVLWLITSAIVAGVAEETAFRGYMQKPIEERHGPVTAILITGVFFGFAHFGHPEVTMILMPYYIAVAAVYGALAYFTNSIYPSMVLHAAGNVAGSINLVARGQSEWQSSSTASRLIWQTGPDASFWLLLIACVAAGGVTIWAYAMLRNVSRRGADHAEGSPGEG